MDGYKILNTADDTSLFSYSRFFFNQSRFLKSVRLENFRSFYLLNSKSHRIEAEITFFLEGEKAVSPLRGSFGSIQLGEHLRPDVLSFFIEGFETELNKAGIRELLIRNYPFAYDARSAAILTAMYLQHQYELQFTDVSYHIDLHLDIEKKLRESEQSRIKSLRSAGFKAVAWKNPDLPEVYEILKVCRDQKDYPMSLSKNDFIRMFELCPDDYFVYKIISGSGETIAVAVNVKINSQVLYNFYIGELPEYRSKSPAALLIFEMSGLAAKEGYQLFDLGIATEKGKPNFGLMNFKRNMGGNPSLKPFFIKKLS